MIGKRNALEDEEISNLVWDVLNLIHEFDWYKSGDTSEEEYIDAKTKFKDKWFKGSRKDRIAKIIDERFELFKIELIRDFLLDNKTLQSLLKEKNADNKNEDYYLTVTEYLNKHIKEKKGV